MKENSINLANANREWTAAIKFGYSPKVDNCWMYLVNTILKQVGVRIGTIQAQPNQRIITAIFGLSFRTEQEAIVETYQIAENVIDKNNTDVTLRGVGVVAKEEASPGLIFDDELSKYRTKKLGHPLIIYSDQPTQNLATVLPFKQI